MPLNELNNPVHSTRSTRSLFGAALGGLVGLVAGSIGLFAAAETAWLLPLDVILGALAGLFMALVSAW